MNWFEDEAANQQETTEVQAFDEHLIEDKPSVKDD